MVFARDGYSRFVAAASIEGKGVTQCVHSSDAAAAAIANEILLLQRSY